MKGKIYVGGLLKSVKKPDVERAFSRFGKLKEVWLAHKPPGFAFVYYVFPEDAEDAIRCMDGKRLAGAKIRVESAKSMGQKGGSGMRGSAPSRSYGPPSPRYRSRGRLPPPPPSRRPYSPPLPRTLSPPPSPPSRRMLPPLRRRSPLPLPPPPPMPPMRRRSPLPMSRGRSISPLPIRRKGRPPSPPGSWSPPPPPRDYGRGDPLPRYRDERSSQYSDRVPYISFDRRRSPLPPPPPLPPVRYRSRSPVSRRRSPPPLPPLPVMSRSREYSPPPLPPVSKMDKRSGDIPKRYRSPDRMDRREKRRPLVSADRKAKRR